MARWNPAHVALRTTAGAFILNTGIGKWKGDEKTAAGVHGMAKGTYPFLDAVAPQPFLKALAAGEITLGAALLTPFVPAAVVGAGLTGFAASLLGLYLGTPGMHDKLRPTQQGNAIAKDVWLLGMGAALLADGLRRKRS
ncbi:hypothetical protein ACFQ34_26510 [Pseudonocardia benzenivorans]|uniref:Membrane protein n=2 Tax=Pseudonocardia TaxID=1847 RepID=F4D1U3_PSEUX|nr:hypothetical protein [Pseudonocardia dioxanivorans]AEA28003.1 membrane protein [Pseudonocardia dioxanivorans CB1190]GJF06305.1 hypothetical protein PSD17_52530 [Pseudonocardia sp. D17]